MSKSEKRVERLAQVFGVIVVTVFSGVFVALVWTGYAPDIGAWPIATLGGFLGALVVAALALVSIVVFGGVSADVVRSVFKRRRGEQR